MLSRVADSLYWMSRYLERAENTVRQLDVDHEPDARFRRRQRGDPLAAPHGLAGQSLRSGMDRRSRSHGAKLVFDKHIRFRHQLRRMRLAKTPARSAKKSPPNSGSASIGSTTRCTRRTRRLSSAPTSTMCLSSVIDAIHLFKGVSDTTMIHGQGWHFIRLGRYLERAYAIATLLEVYQPDLFRATGARALRLPIPRAGGPSALLYGF